MDTKDFDECHQMLKKEKEINPVMKRVKKTSRNKHKPADLTMSAVAVTVLIINMLTTATEQVTLATRDLKC